MAQRWAQVMRATTTIFEDDAMHYEEHDSGAPAVDAQESADEAMACAQVEMDKQAAQDAEPVPF